MSGEGFTHVSIHGQMIVRPCEWDVDGRVVAFDVHTESIDGRTTTSRLDGPLAPFLWQALADGARAALPDRRGLAGASAL